MDETFLYNQTIEQIADKINSFGDSLSHIIALLLNVEMFNHKAKDALAKKNSSIANNNYAQKRYHLKLAVDAIREYNETVEEKIFVGWTTDVYSSVEFPYVVVIRLPHFDALAFHNAHKLVDVHMDKHIKISQKTNRTKLKNIIRKLYDGRLSITTSNDSQSDNSKSADVKVKHKKKRLELKDDDEWLLKPVERIRRVVEEKVEKTSKASVAKQLDTHINSGMTQSEKFLERFARFKKS